MNIKQILASAALMLPFAVTSMPAQASVLVVNPHGHSTVVRRIVKRPPVRKKVFIPGHWEKTNRGRRWVPAHYVYR